MVAQLPSIDSELTIRPYERRDLASLRRLSFYNYHLHSHLDWQSVEDYLRTDPNGLWVAYHQDTMRGAFGISEPVDGHTWLRFVVCDDVHEPFRVLQTLWTSIQPQLVANGIRSVSVLLMREWIEDWIESVGFRYQEHIVTLRYDRTTPPMMPVLPSVNFIRAETYHVPQITRVDYAAFSDPWRMSAREVRMALRAGTYNTAAIINGQLVGYLIGTQYGNNGHLARLGVHPDGQGRGIGSALIIDMLHWFAKRNVYNVTVNTQNSNTRSLHVYERYHFQRTGFDVPVYTFTLDTP